MKHRSGIELAPFPPSEYVPHDKASNRTLSDLAEWETIGARCGRCGRIRWLDKNALMRKIGVRDLNDLRKLLVCRCGNRDSNTVLVGKLPR